MAQPRSTKFLVADDPFALLLHAITTTTAAILSLASSTDMDDAPSSLHDTTVLKTIAVDYNEDACHHSPDEDEIHVTYDNRGGSRWRSTHRFLHGTFSALIRCPLGNTSGLNFNLYLSSLEGDTCQDEIDFEFLGKDKTIVQTNYHCDGTGGKEVIHDLGFDSSDDFREYKIRWEPDAIEWLVDGVVIRREEREEDNPFPGKPMFLYASVWDASCVDEGRWTGEYLGENEPYVCWYKDVNVPMEMVMPE